MTFGRRARLLPLGLVLLAACSDDTPSGPEPPSPVHSVEFDPDSLLLFVGQLADLEPTLRAEDGTMLLGRSIQFTSSNPGVVFITPSRRARADAEGAAVITATSEGVSGTLVVTVEDAPALEVTGIEPDSLVEGESVVIRGTGFVGDDVGVRIAGMDAHLLSRSDSVIEAVVPAICRPPGPVDLDVEVLGGLVTRRVSHPNAASTPFQMERGEFRLLSDPAGFCLHFLPSDASEEYVVGVQSTSFAVSSLTPVRFRAVAGAGSADPMVADGSRRVVTPAPRGRSFGDLVDPASRRWDRHWRAEGRLRELDQRVVEERGPGRVGGPPGAAALELPLAGASVPPGVQEGQRIEIRIPDIDGNNLCRDYKAVTTEVRHVGERAVWLEDTANPTGGFSGSDYRTLGDRFDESIYPVVAETFGEPTDIDGNGRIVIVVSRAVNDFQANVLGFVTTADFFRRLEDNCASSDFGEYFYVRAPISGSSYDRDEALSDFPRLIAHELTHVVQFGRRVERGHPLQTVWELEGQAVLGEEVAGHRATGRQPRSNLGIDVGLGRESDTDTGWYLRGFNDIFRYHGLAGSPDNWRRVSNAPERCTWIARNVSAQGAPCEMGGREPYGVPWSLLRWLADHFHPDFPGGEAGFHGGMIDSGSVGIQNVEHLTGEPAELLLAQWAAALYVDGRVEGGDPRVGFPSWDLLEFDERLIEEARLVPRTRAFSSFSFDVQVRAASTAYFLVQGEGGRPATSIRVRGAMEAPLPDHMQLWLVRLR